MRTGLPKQKKVTDSWFEEKDPLIHIRTHNTDLKKRLAAYAAVSYTHLDVYKRQVLRTGIRVVPSRMMPPPAISCLIPCDFAYV